MNGNMAGGATFGNETYTDTEDTDVAICACANASNADEWLWISWSYCPWTASCYSVLKASVIVTLASVLMLVIVFGNLLVVLAVKNDARLMKQRQNWLIVSLAVADLLVGLLVMPLTLLYEIVGQWILGMVLCELWLALDVLFVTASILNLCVISLDRYWCVTKPLVYPQQRTPNRMRMLIGAAWGLAIMVSVPPLIGWRRPRRDGICELSTDIGYVLYSSMLSYYLPIVVLALAYARIYQITRRHTRKRLKEIRSLDKTLNKHTLSSAENSSASPHKTKDLRALLLELQAYDIGYEPASKPTERNGKVRRWCRGRGHGRRQSLRILPRSTFTTVATATATALPAAYLPSRYVEPDFSTDAEPIELKRLSGLEAHETDELLTPTSVSTGVSTLPPSSSSAASMMPSPKEQARRAQMEGVAVRRRQLKQKERQAVLLLGLILTAFIASWLPFFVCYLLGAFGITADLILFKVFFWLGYCNSGINPFIYTVFNQEFRNAIRRLLRIRRNGFGGGRCWYFCCCRTALTKR